MKAISIITSALLLAGCAWASPEAAKPVPLEKSQSPNGAMTVFIVSSSTNAERKLALVSLEPKAVLADVPLPNAAPAAGLSKTTVLWKRDNTGVAVSFSDRTNSVIFACVKVGGDRWKWLDMRVAEGPNLGVLGRPRSDFVRVEDTPTRWTDETDHTPRMVWVRSRFWDKTGQRYTVESEFSITPTGEVGWK